MAEISLKTGTEPVLKRWWLRRSAANFAERLVRRRDRRPDEHATGRERQPDQ